MTEKPILFSGPMVRAILDRRKTQTRRVMKNAFIPGPYDIVRWAKRLWAPVTKSGKMFIDNTWQPFTCPYDADRLWVREQWQYADWTEEGQPIIGYAADKAKLLREPDSDEWGERVANIWAQLSLPENYNIDNRASDRRWRPSIHMPRWASRINLTVKDIRVERLREISEEDARAEGIIDGGCLNCGEHEPCGCTDPAPDARDAFIYLWNSINEKRGYGWDVNPLVWVVEFEVENL